MTDCFFLRENINTYVDTESTNALDMVPDNSTKIAYTDLKPQVRQFLINKWQQL